MDEVTCSDHEVKPSIATRSAVVFAEVSHASGHALTRAR
jgi:NAD-specific glutamate dehydrogenase